MNSRFSKTRITPAYAGKRLPTRVPSLRNPHHPRVRGEKAQKALGRGLGQGSPPRTRGKVPKRVGRIGAVGITPAYAGKSVIFPAHRTDVRDHPRVRGEKGPGDCPGLLAVGSPPRTRGKAGWRAGPPHAAGITPAYAGKRQQKKSYHKPARDHPRVRGEKHHLHHDLGAARGSPPRTRGKAPGGLFGSLVGGITPAYAGKRIPGQIL